MTVAVSSFSKQGHCHPQMLVLSALVEDCSVCLISLVVVVVCVTHKILWFETSPSICILSSCRDVLRSYEHNLCQFLLQFQPGCSCTCDWGSEFLSCCQRFVFCCSDSSSHQTGSAILQNWKTDEGLQGSQVRSRFRPRLRSFRVEECKMINSCDGKCLGSCGDCRMTWRTFTLGFYIPLLVPPWFSECSSLLLHFKKKVMIVLLCLQSMEEALL